MARTKLSPFFNLLSLSNFLKSYPSIMCSLIEIRTLFNGEFNSSKSLINIKSIGEINELDEFAF